MLTLIKCYPSALIFPLHLCSNAKQKCFQLGILRKTQCILIFFSVISNSIGLFPNYYTVKTILSQKSTAFRNRQNVLTRFLQMSTRSFINFDVNKRRNILDSILLALFYKKARHTDKLIHFFSGTICMIFNFVISVMKKEM